ncbi:restriction endonuclease subunit S [Microcystis elabens FACHB-917]|nr:restriction endonuclease subunit S [Microcystis elabens FACHB-917]
MSLRSFVADQELKKETLSRIWIVLPPLEEQDEIITHLELLDASLSSLCKYSTASSLIASGVEILTDVS